MRKIAIVGSGQAGLLAAHGLLQAGYEVELYSDRTPEEWLTTARPTGTAVRFSRSLGYEHALGLDRWHADAPPMDGLKVTICASAARPFLTMLGRFRTSPQGLRRGRRSSPASRIFRLTARSRAPARSSLVESAWARV
jgi:glycine/D-amino acid oxidase-like deaminating enzyme